MPMLSRQFRPLCAAAVLLLAASPATAQTRATQIRELDAYITRALGRADVVALGFDETTVDFVTRLVDRAEWKRRQGAIGPKISGMAFGRDRRLPITYRPNL